MPRFDPAQYPGERPDGPVLVIRDEVVPLRLDGHPDAPLVVDAPTSVAAGSIRVLQAGVARFAVAYGSNASPLRLMDKELTSRGAILLPAVVRGWVAAFEARRTGYGAVPLTFVPSPGAVTSTWVLGLHPDDLAQLDRTEGRVPDGRDTTAEVGRTRDPARFAPPGTYRLGRVGDVRIAERLMLRRAMAYLPGPATHVQMTGHGWRTYPAHDQAAAARHVEGDGPSAPAPPPAQAVVGPWPRTPLEPLT